MRRALKPLVWLLLALPMAGCGIPQWWLSAQSGTLFQGTDALVPQGQAATLTVTLRGGSLLTGQSDYTVFFYYQGQRIGVAKTDSSGIAQIQYTFEDPGPHEVTATLDPAEIGVPNVPKTTMRIAVQPRDKPIILVDLDKTTVAGDFDQVVLSDPIESPGSQQVLRNLQGRYQVVFFTSRPEQFVGRTRRWLAEHDYPPLPVLTKRPGQATLSQAAFKKQRIEQLKEDFSNIQWLIDDQIPNAKVGSELGLRVILPVIPQDLTAGKMQRLIEALEDLPPDAQVVFNWQQVQQAIEGEADFSRTKVQPELLRLAREKAQSQQQAVEQARRRGEQP